MIVDMESKPRYAAAVLLAVVIGLLVSIAYVFGIR